MNQYPVFQIFEHLRELPRYPDTAVYTRVVAKNPDLLKERDYNKILEFTKFSTEPFCRASLLIQL
jgi:hypothetical protein